MKYEYKTFVLYRFVTMDTSCYVLSWNKTDCNSPSGFKCIHKLTELHRDFYTNWLPYTGISL
jgi:hypothetical protein